MVTTKSLIKTDALLTQVSPSSFETKDRVFKLCTLENYVRKISISEVNAVAANSSNSCLKEHAEFYAAFLTNHGPFNPPEDAIPTEDDP